MMMNKQRNRITQQRPTETCANATGKNDRTKASRGKAFDLAIQGKKEQYP